MPRAGFDPASPTRKASILSTLNFSLTGLYYRGVGAWLPRAPIRGLPMEMAATNNLLLVM